MDDADAQDLVSELLEGFLFDFGNLRFSEDDVNQLGDVVYGESVQILLEVLATDAGVDIVFAGGADAALKEAARVDADKNAGYQR